MAFSWRATPQILKKDIERVCYDPLRSMFGYLRAGDSRRVARSISEDHS